MGNWSKAIKRIGNELKLTPTSRQYKFEFSYVGNDCRPLQKSGMGRENKNTPNLSATIPEVSLAAVLSLIMQRSSPWGGALRDETQNSCEGDYHPRRSEMSTISSFHWSGKSVMVRKQRNPRSSGISPKYEN